MSSVGIELTNEIERVWAKRERWRGYQTTCGPQAMFGPGIALMTAAIEEAKAALYGDDPVRAIRAYEVLKGYDDED